MSTVDSMDALSSVPQPLGPRIRVARENAGLSIDETARRLGVTAATLEAWETDQEEPRANRLVTLAGVLKVSLAWFLEGREDQQMSAAETPPEHEALRAQLEEIRSQLDEVLALVSDMEAQLSQPKD